MLVDIFLLNVMKTHESLYCFDNALRVSDQIMVCIRSRRLVFDGEAKKFSVK